MNTFHDIKHTLVLISYGGRELALAGKNAAIMLLLLQHPGGLTRYEMLQKAHPSLGLWAERGVCRLRCYDVPIETLNEKETTQCGETLAVVRYRVSGPVQLLKASKLV